MDVLPFLSFVPILFLKFPVPFAVARGFIGMFAHKEDFGSFLPDFQSFFGGESFFFEIVFYFANGRRQENEEAGQKEVSTLNSETDYKIE